MFQFDNLSNMWTRICIVQCYKHIWRREKFIIDKNVVGGELNFVKIKLKSCHSKKNSYKIGNSKKVWIDYGAFDKTVCPYIQK